MTENPHLSEKCRLSLLDLWAFQTFRAREKTAAVSRQVSFWAHLRTRIFVGESQEENQSPGSFESGVGVSIQILFLKSHR